MSKSDKVITYAIVGGCVIAGYSYYLTMRKTQADLEIVPTAGIHSINWDGIVIRLDLVLKNPSKGSFSIKFPFVKLSYKNTLVGSSEVVNKDIKIPAYGEAKIEKLLVSIPIMSIFSVSTSILKAIQSKEPVKVTATLKTTIDLGFTKLPFEESHEVTLKK